MLLICDSRRAIRLDGDRSILVSIDQTRMSSEFWMLNRMGVYDIILG